MHASAPPGSAVLVAPPDPRRARLSRSADDDVLVALAAAGDPRAFELLVQRYRPGLLGYATRMLGDAARAEDAVQETFVAAMRALGNGQRPGHLRGWLHEIVRRACIDQWRGAQRRAEVSLHEPERLGRADQRRLAVSEEAALRGAGDREALHLLRAAFGELSAMQHDILVQRELEGRSPGEIAERLGVSRNVVDGQLARGRRALTSAYRALQSGQRCAEARALCTDEASLSGGQRRRLALHLRGCESCRRHAAERGVAPALLGSGILARAALLLPLPLLRRLPGGESALAGDLAGSVLGAKLAVGAALMASGTGALVVGDVPSVLPRPARAVTHPAATAPTTASSDHAVAGASPRAERASRVARSPRGGTPPGVVRLRTHGGPESLGAAAAVLPLDVAVPVRPLVPIQPVAPPSPTATAPGRTASPAASTAVRAPAAPVADAAVDVPAEPEATAVVPPALVDRPAAVEPPAGASAPTTAPAPEPVPIAPVADPAPAPPVADPAPSAAPVPAPDPAPSAPEAAPVATDPAPTGEPTPTAASAATGAPATAELAGGA